MGDQFRDREKDPRPHSRWELYRYGRRARAPERDARPQKRLETRLDCDTCPTAEGDFTQRGFGVSSCYQSCQEPPPCRPARHCSALQVDKGIKENR